MAANSKIEWTTHTFNPWIGCTKVAAGCEHCYAERDMAKRLGKVQWGPHGTRVKTSAANWRKPLAWNRAAACDQSFDCNAGDHSDACPQSNRPRVFCASLADVFEDWPGNISSGRAEIVPACPENGFQQEIFRPLMWWRNDRGVCKSGETTVDRSRGERLATMNDLRRELFALIDATPNLDWLLLTKRPENIRRMTYDAWTEKVPGHVSQNEGDGRIWQPRPNVWLGTSIANQADADQNIPELLKCRKLAPVLFVSAQPLLGPVDLTSVAWPDIPNHRVDVLRCGYWNREGVSGCGPSAELGAPRGGFTNHSDMPGPIDWVICGGESGPHARPMHPDWARGLRDQCVAAGVPFFFKQWGEWAPWWVADNIPRRNNAPYGEFHDRQPSSWIDDCLCEEGSMTLYGVGKKAAGRMLDGREWNELPALNAHCS